MVNFGDLVSEVAILIRPLMTVKNNSIRVLSDSVNISVRCDSEQMKQVLFNLLMNAQEANGDGGTISLRYWLENAMFVLSISDSGPGIAPEDIEQVFEPFFTTKASGTGLGLSVVQQIISHHGGDIRVFNTSEGGACFLLRIPVGRDDTDG
jgi:signal transduction histidine kinase